MNLANLIYVEESRLGYNIRLSSVKGSGHSQALQWIPKTYGEYDRVARYNAVTVAQHFFNNLLDTFEEMTDKDIESYLVKLVKENEKLDEEPNFKDYSDLDVK